jgi:hypothetical protein
MDGRWTLLVNRRGEAWVCDPDVSVFPQTGESLTPVVPCDDGREAGRAKTRSASTSRLAHAEFGVPPPRPCWPRAGEAS